MRAVTTEAAATLEIAVHRGDPRAVEELLATPGALLTGHFELLSGRHTDRFFAFSRIAEDTEAVQLVARWLEPALAPLLPDGLVAPSTAGVGLGWALACRLGVPMHLAQLDESGRASGLLGDPDLAGQRLGLVNDIVTTGDGLRALAGVARMAGGEVIGAAWFLSRDRIDVDAMIGAPGIGILNAELPSWPGGDCSLCSAGEPLRLGIDLN